MGKQQENIEKFQENLQKRLIKTERQIKVSLTDPNDLDAAIIRAQIDGRKVLSVRNEFRR